MTDVYRFLADHHIEYKRHDHPPVFTVADVERLVPPLPAAKTQNLFLRDQKGKRHFLVVVPAQKRVDIKALSSAIGAGRLSFGSPDRLKRYLGVDPGSVTILALIRDSDHAVEVVFDKTLGQEKAFQFQQRGLHVYINMPLHIEFGLFLTMNGRKSVNVCTFS